MNSGCNTFVFISNHFRGKEVERLLCFTKTDMKVHETPAEGTV